MSPRDLKIFLALQIFAIVLAGAVFSIFASRLLAGAIAGGYFVISGLYMVWRAWKWPQKWRAFCIYPLLMHVFLISIPMVVSRFLQAGLGFEEVRIFGLPGPAFHQLSSAVFFTLLLSTIIDLFRVIRFRKASER